MDVNNLFIKLDYSKDYATKELLEAFLQLKYPKKLAIGAGGITGIKADTRAVVNIEEYDLDGTVLFRKSLRYIDYASLLKDNVIRKPAVVKGYLLSRWLKPGGIDKPAH
jgi:uncharacterized protein (DUF1919 family)